MAVQSIGQVEVMPLSEIRQTILQVAHDNIEESADGIRKEIAAGSEERPNGDSDADLTGDLMGMLEWHEELHRWADEEDFDVHTSISLKEGE